MPGNSKRPMTSFMLWFNSVRQQLKSDNPGLKVTEIAKKAGEIWNSMNNKSKRKWKDLAAKAKEQYITELNHRNANGGESSKWAQKRPMIDSKSWSKAKYRKKI